MVVLFSKLYSEQLGCSKYEIELEQPVKLIQLLELLEDSFPWFGNNSKGTTAEKYAAHFLCISGGRILRLEDSIGNQDIMEVIPPLIGG